jgi:hypothetical protein
MVGLVSGMRCGVDWPAPGQSIDVPEREARELIASGIAKAAPSAPVAETASVTVAAETAAMPRPKQKGTGNR